jgi:integrase
MAPTTVSSSVRTREYLTTREIERLMAADRKSSRYDHRDATMILIGYRHGLRASELCDLRWSQVELTAGRLHVRRAKSGSPSVHPMQGDEIRALRRLQREQEPSSHVFMTERGGPMTPKAFHALFGRIGSGPRCRFRSIRTCCAMAAAMRLPMPAMISGRCRPISATRTSSTRSAIPSLRRTGSRTAGANQAEKRDVEKGWELVELHGLWWAYRGELPPPEAFQTHGR